MCFALLNLLQKFHFMLNLLDVLGTIEKRQEIAKEPSQLLCRIHGTEQERVADNTKTCSELFHLLCFRVQPMLLFVVLRFSIGGLGQMHIYWFNVDLVK